MHRRFLTALAAVSLLTMAGCGSSKSGSSAAGSGAGTAVSTTSASNPSGGPVSTTGTGDPAAADTSSAAGMGDRSGPCAGLDAKIVPLPGVASGTTFSNLVVTNRGKTACMLPGQPKIEYLTENHKRIVVGFSSDPALQPHELLPGASAAMAIGYSGDSEPPCDGKIAYLRVTPPGADLPVDGRTHCLHDETHDEGWVTGSYAAPH